MFDLLIKGGRVIDPSQDIDGVLDVAIAGGKVATIAKDISAQEGRQVIDAGGRVVTPGLIELHCHVAGGIHVGSVDPDLAGVNQGVTTVVDGGSTGAKIFAAFPRYIIPSSRTRVFCFLHLSSLGLTIKPELRYDEIDLEATAAAIESYRGLIKGVKLMLIGPVLAREGTKIVQMAQKVAKQFRLPIMVHIGDGKKQVSPTLTRETLPMMESGDVLSHIYTAEFGGLLRADGAVFPEVKEAMNRGVVMDTALGMNNFAFEVARKSIAQGILPTTLSSDLTARNSKDRVYGMTVTMTKFLALGLDLKQIVKMSTMNPARVLGEESRIGSLRPGVEADVSILEVLSGKWKLEDSVQQTIEVDRLIAPSTTVRAGQVIPAQASAQLAPLRQR